MAVPSLPPSDSQAPNESREAQVRRLVRQLAEAQKALAGLAGGADLVVDPDSGTPILLQEAQTSLQAANEELERRVRERTAELEQEQSLLEQRVEERTASLREAAQELARREAALTSANERLALLHEIDRSILAARAPAEIAAAAAQGLRLALDAARVAVLLWDEDGGTLEIAALDGVLPEGFTPGMRVARERYAAYEQNSRGETVVVADPAAPPDPFATVQASLGQGLRSYAGIPVMVGGRTIGALAIARASTERWSDDDLALGRQVADSLAVAIHNARLLGEVLRGRQQLQQLSRRLVDTQETERKNISRELHDETGQGMTSLTLALGLLKRDIQGDAELEARLGQLQELAYGVMEGLHRLAVNLRPSSLDRLGLVPALEQYVATLARQTDLDIQLLAEDLAGARLPDEIETALYRIVQEGLTNVVRHANAGHVGVMLNRKADSVLVIIEDDGVGFDAEEAMRRSRLGLVGMRERAEMLGGGLTIESQPGSGTTLYLEVPADPDSP